MITEQLLRFEADIQVELSQLGVLAVYFFGSRAYGLANHESDFDFGVLLHDPKQVAQTSLGLYQSIYDILSKLIKPETLNADVIDIVFLDSPRVPLELKFHIVNHGQVLFDADPQERLNREDQFMIQTADFAPFRTVMSQTLLARL